MTHNVVSNLPVDPVDELVTHLLDAGGVLSQIVGQMVEFQASGRSAPDLAAIPENAHSLIRDVLDPLRKGHSKRDIQVAAAIIEQATAAICENILFVDLG